MAKKDKAEPVKQMTAVTDPLEAAKISDKPPPPEPPPEPPPPVLHVASGEVEPPKPPVKKYKVMETTWLWLLGQHTRLNRDDIVSESSYGPLGMKRILDSNVPLMELKE